MAKFPGTLPPPPRYLSHRQQRETLEEHEAAQEAIELTTWKRIHDETMSAAFLEAQEAPDEPTAMAIREKASAQVGAILKTTSVRVQNAYAQYVQGSQASWGDRFARQAKAVKEKNLFDQSEQNIEAYTRSGNLEEAAKAIEFRSVGFPELRAKGEQQITELPATSAVWGVRNAVADGDLALAETLIAQARQVTSLTVEQKEDLNKMEGAIGRAGKEQMAQAKVELLVRADKAASLPPIERFAEIERIKGLYAQTGVSPAELRVNFNWLDALAKGEPFEVDPMAEIEANDIIRSLDADSTTQESTDARNQILALMPRLGAKTAGYIKELGTRLDKEKAQAVEYALDEGVAKGLLDPAYVAVVRRNIEKYINAQEGDVSPADIIQRGAEIAAMGPKPPLKAAPSAYKVATVQGALWTGKYQLASGEWKTLEELAWPAGPPVIPEEATPEEREKLEAERRRDVGATAYDYLVTELGLQWRTQIPPEQVTVLEDIFARQYPGFEVPTYAPPQAGPESLEGWDDLTADQQAELKRRWGQSR